MGKSAREAAFSALLKIEKDSAYSTLALDSVLSSAGLDGRDRSFASALVYGVTERKLTLDYNLSLYLNQPLKKLKKNVLTLLRMGAYQVFFMEKVPDSAAVNESVALAKKAGAAYAASMINAVLRRCSASGLLFPESGSETEKLSVRYSCSREIIDLLLSQYPAEDVKGFFEHTLETQTAFIRVNALKISEDELIALLAEEGVEAKKTTLENAISVDFRGRSVASLDSFSKGLFHVQDLSSQLCAAALCAQPGNTVFDLCSAPGGKAFTAAQFMKNEGRLLAFDLYPQRAKLIADGAKRLGMDIVEASAADASVFDESLPQADRVLCDVPCSGLGIIGKKPEIKYKNPAEFAELPQLQLKILQNGADYLAPDGRLVYSTCTVNKAENEDVVQRFLSQNKGFEPAEVTGGKSMITLLPHINGCDGFFIAAFKKT